jgi:uncharacterized membrane protein
MSGITILGMLLGRYVLGKLLFIAVIAGLFSLYRLLRGIALLLKGRRYLGSVTEIGEGWFEGWFK